MVWSQFHLPPKKTRRKHLTMCIPNSKAHLLQLKRNSFHRNSYSGTIWNRKCFILIFLIPERLLDRIARIWGGNSLREAGILRALSFSVFKGDGKKLLSPGTDQRSYIFFFLNQYSRVQPLSFVWLWMCSKYQTPVVCSKAKREQAGSDHAMSFSSGHGLLRYEESVWCLSRTLPQMCLWAAASLLGTSTCLEGHLPAEDSNPGSYVACTHRRKKRERERKGITERPWEEGHRIFQMSLFHLPTAPASILERDRLRLRHLYIENVWGNESLQPLKDQQRW